MAEEFIEDPELLVGEPSQFRRGPLSLELTAESSVLREARVLAGDRNVLINHLANVIAQDPVITLEMLRVANATFFSADRPAITTVQTALVRLGSQIIIELLTTIAHRPPIEDQEVARVFESLRVLCKKTSKVARIVSQVTNPDISEICQTTGLMSPLGHMIACAYLGRNYLNAAKRRKRSALPYKLNQDFHYNLQSVHLDYLRNRGIPSILFYGLDRELVCKTTTQSALRFVVESASELVEAWEHDKWDKYHPNRILPPKSALRLLKMNETQYEAIYETVDAYLHDRKEDDEIVEERLRRSSGQFPAITEADLTDKALQEEEEKIFFPSADSLNHASVVEPPPSPEEEERARALAREKRENRMVVIKRNGFDRETKDSRPTLVLNREGFGGYDPSAQPTNFINPSEEDIKEEQKELSPDAQKVLNLIEYLCRECENVQTLLERLLKLLITDGPFVRAALLMLTEHRKTAEIHTAVGEGFVEEEEIRVKDPLSPLALCLTKIKSFNAKTIEDLISPFGISSYAVSPVKIRSDAPIVLYADCGLNQPLPMEARRIFRLVVGLLNQTLPRLPGGLPKKSVKEVSHSSNLPRG
jgi:HD-like signal output (HDOD) protein